MAEPIRPNSTKTLGKTNWVLVATVASGSLVPTAIEVNAAGSLDITRMVFASSGKPTQSTNRATAERRLGDTKSYEFVGISQVTGGEMTYVYGAQSAALSDPKKMYERIPEGTTGYLVERKGVSRATTPAAGQFVNVYPVEFGPSFPIDVGQDESAESAMTVTFAVTSDPAIGVALT